MGERMTTVRQYLVFLTGHRISARTPAEEVGSLSKIGAAIAFASFFSRFAIWYCWLVFGNGFAYYFANSDGSGVCRDWRSDCASP